LIFNNSERLEVTFEETDFTHRAILRIKNVQKSDETEYYCKALTPDNLPDRIRFEFIVNGTFHKKKLIMTLFIKCIIYYIVPLLNIQIKHNVYFYIFVSVILLTFLFLDPKVPYFTNVNMNGTEVIISARESHNTINLICHAEGMPKPTITWYKVKKWHIK
jgi:hypothetical protein